MKKLIWFAVIVAVMLCSCPPPFPPPPPPGPPGPPGPPRRPPKSPRTQTPDVYLDRETTLVELFDEAVEGQSSAYLVVQSDR